MTNDSGLSRKQRLGLVLAGALLVLLLPLIVSAISTLTAPYTATENVTYEASDGPIIHLGTDLESDADEPFPDAHSVNMSPHAEIYSNGTTEATVDQFGTDDGDTTILTDLDVQNNTLEVDVDGKNTVGIQGDANRLEFDDPELDQGAVMTVYQTGSSTVSVHGLDEESVAVFDADSGEMIALADTQDGVATFSVDGDTSIEMQSAGSAPSIDRNSASPVGDRSTPAETLEVDVENDRDVETTVEFELDGSVVGTDTVQGSGRASVSISEEAGGTHTWTATAEDDFGQTSSESFEYALPDELVIRDVNSRDLIQNANVTVEFFSGEVVVERETQDGTIDMTGVPVEEDLIIRADADGYHSRATIIPSIVDQQTAWLLSESEDTVLNEFQLDDETGNFRIGESRMVVSRAIDDGNGSSQYQAVAGDYFGSDGYFSADLEEGVRYRLAVVNDDGARRDVGVYTPTSAGTRTINVGTTSWTEPEDQSYATRAAIETEEVNGEEISSVVFEFGDPHDRATDLNVEIVNRFNESEILYSETIDDPADYRIVHQLNETQEEEQWLVKYTVQVDGEQREGQIPVGVNDTVTPPISLQWMEIGVIIIVVMIAAAFPGSLSSIGGFAVVAMAGAAMLMGWLSIPIYAWMAAAFIAVLGLVRAHRDPL